MLSGNHSSRFDVRSQRVTHPQSGQGLVEYLLILAMVGLMATAGMEKIASGLNTAFSTVGSAVSQYISQPAPPDPIAEALKEAVKNLRDGRILLDSPSTMTQGSNETVQVRIANNLDTDLTTGINKIIGKSSPQPESIRVGPKMTVLLNGSAFAVTPLTTAEQAVASDTFTTWAWTVEPLDSGEQTLHLWVAVRLPVSKEKDEPRFAPVYDKKIQVRVDKMFWSRRFLSKNWQWLTATFLLPIYAYIRQRRIARQENRKKEQEENRGRIILT